MGGGLDVAIRISPCASQGKDPSTNENFLGANFASKDRTSLPSGNRDSSLTLTRQVRLNLLSAARWLYQNVGFVKGTVRDIARYGVGSGLRPQSQIADRAVAEQYEDFWRKWSKIPEPTGRWNHGELQRLTGIAVDVDADIGRVYLKPASRWPQVALVPAHRIGVSDAGAGPGRGGFRDGVMG